MSLAAREQRILDGMETTLQAGETRLTSMFALFTRLFRDEEKPGTEELAAPSWRPRSWLNAPRATSGHPRNAWCRSPSRARWATGRPAAQLRAIALIPVALAAIASLVLLGMITASMRSCGLVNAGHTSERVLSRAMTCQPSPQVPVPAPRHGP
jgi:hypothetical protein